MIYTIGCGKGRKATKVTTLAAIKTALSIDKILDWRATVDSTAVQIDALRDALGEAYSYVGNRCNAGQIGAKAIDKLAAMSEGVMPAMFDVSSHRSLVRFSYKGLVVA